MTKKEQFAKLALVKTALAEKYEQAVKNSNSKPRQVSLKHQAAKYRRQAAELAKKQLAKK